MTRTNVGILRGGTSNEYNLSLKTGAAMMAALPEAQYEVRDILIDRNGMWYSRGLPADPVRALAQVDVVLNALHGGVGEDGTVQRILERLALPYAGARPLPASFSLNKFQACELARQAGLSVPQGTMFMASYPLTSTEMAKAVFSRFGPPYVVKPVREGASYGVRYIPTIVGLGDAIADALELYGSALVEEYIKGHDVSMGVIEDFRGEDLYALPPVHVIAPQGHMCITSELHERGSAKHLVPSSFSDSEKSALAGAARAAHRALGLSHFSRSDFRLTPRGPVFLEVNAIPGLYPGAPFPRALDFVGASQREFLEHAINLARG